MPFFTSWRSFGGLIGLLLVAKVLKRAIADPSVNYIVTVPGSRSWSCVIAEVIISFGLMTIVLCTSNNQRLAQWTGVFAGILVATYITLEAPFSGMSMNPAPFGIGSSCSSLDSSGSTLPHSWECCWQQVYLLGSKAQIQSSAPN